MFKRGERLMFVVNLCPVVAKYTRFKLYGHFPTAREHLLMSDNMFYLDPKTGYFFKDEHYSKTVDLLEKPVSKAWIK